MRLAGWNDIPAGYGAEFDVASAPWWLRLWFRTPFVDRFAYPQLVRRGLAFLSPSPGGPAGQRGPVTGGWRLREPGYSPPGATTELHPEGGR